jgi:hypothetical protein
VTVERLTADDNLFLIMEQVMGIPAVPQVIWRIPVSRSGTDGDATAQALHAVRTVGRRLAAGRLSRLVRRTAGPARDRWIFTPEAGRTRVVDAPVNADSVAEWAELRLRAALDSEDRIDSVTGPAWELSAAPTTDGCVVVSLVRSHVVADGAAMIRAVTSAVDGADDVSAAIAGAREPADRWARVRDQLADSASLIAGSARAGWGLLRRAVADRSARTTGAATSDRARPQVGATGPVTVPTVAVRVDADAFDRAAASAGGTANSLFQAVTLGVLAASGRVREGDDVPVSVPMSLRDDPDLVGDLRANSTTGATLHVTADPDRYTDLSPVRTAAKTAYRAVTGREGPDAVAALALIAQALPDALVKLGTSGATTPLCLASNLGDPGPRFTGLGLTAPAGTGSTGDAGSAEPGVALRTVLRADSPRELAARQGGVSAWAVRCGSSLSLSFTSLDPVHVKDRDQLLELVTDELHRRGLNCEQWL